MQLPGHAAVRWDLIFAVIAIALGFVSTAIGPNRVGRVLLWAGAYGFVLVAYFIYTAATDMNLLQKVAIALVFTCAIGAVAWSPVRRFLREEQAGTLIPPAIPLPGSPATHHPAHSTNPLIEHAIKRAIEQDAERLREAIATGHIPPPDPMREHAQALLDESALMPPRGPRIIDLERFTTIAYGVARRWSNETPTQPVRIVYGTDTQFGLSRGPVAATLTQNGDRVDVELGSLDHRAPYKTVPITERDAEEIGKEIGMRMRA
jgi:hypothetical protein